MTELLALPALVIVLAFWVGHSLFLNRRLVESQNRYWQFFSDSPVALVVIDANHTIIEWNQSAEAIFGWSQKEALGGNILDLIVPNFDRDHVVSILEKASNDGVSYSKNYMICRRSDEIFCEWRNRRLDDNSGEILCMAQDITLSQKTLDELHKRSTALENAGDAIFYTDKKGIIEYANPSFFALELSDQHTLYGSHIGKYLFKERLEFNATLAHVGPNNTWRGTLSKLSASGEKVFSVTITAIYHHNRLISYVANLHDITHISSHVDDLTYRVQHDPLTGATNRTALFDRLEHAITRSQRRKEKIALYFIDLNDFKLVNDQYGHEAGDRLLQDVAHNIRSCLRNSDTVCRYGGDEFIVMIEEVKGTDHLQSILEAIQTAIGEPIPINEHTTLYARASIGMALYPDDADTPEELIKAADSAMYVVKREKNHTVRGPVLCVESHDH